MLTPSHIAFSYLLSQSLRLIGYVPNASDIGQIILAGNIVDLDFLWTNAMGKKADAHHALPTHTPIGVFLIGLLWIVILGNQNNTILNISIFLSLLLHLILDDLGYWFCKLKLQQESRYPQIN